MLLWALFSFSSAVYANQTEDAVSAGEYLLHAAGCVGCHTDVEGNGPTLAGGRRLDTPFGTFYSPNITPHRATGIGAWTPHQFAAALRRGEGPGGKHYYPVFPYPSYTKMATEDALAIFDYLETVPAVDRPNKPHELPWLLRFRFLNWGWKQLFMDEGELRDAKGLSRQERGGYLVNALAHCGECHTSRNLFGALRADRALAGNLRGPEGEVVPNITPHPADGIGNWSDDELSDYLATGMTPDGDFAGGAMAEVIEDCTSKLHPADLEAAVLYLRRVPALPSVPE